MTMFRDREKAFEAKFAHDAEREFRATVACQRRLAAWAADLMQKPPAEAETYVTAMLSLALHGEDLAARLARDLGAPHSPQALSDRLEAMKRAARMVPRNDNRPLH